MEGRERWKECEKKGFTVKSENAKNDQSIIDLWFLRDLMFRDLFSVLEAIFSNLHTKAHQSTPKHTKAHQSTPKHTKAHQSTPKHTKAHQSTPKHTNKRAPREGKSQSIHHHLKGEAEKDNH
eukprot:scaffold7349_cov173-Amphora_coffeaeformis.AAC.92